jgi:hypothetical protein
MDDKLGEHIAGLEKYEIQKQLFRSLKRLGHRRRHNIKLDIKYREHEDVDWIQLAKDRV